MSIRAATQQMNAERTIADTLAREKRGAAPRIAALDFTKGALVLTMVLYHWINYFIGPQWPYYFYLRFLTPSFIFISGFIISHIYLSKYDAADARLPKRLLVRGLKLIVIFVVLNMARALVIPILSPGTQLAHPLALNNILAIFVTGNFPVTSKIASFSILVPIAYLLMFSAILMFPYRFYQYLFHAVCVLLLMAISGLALIGAQSLNLEYVAIGMFGVLIGFAPIRAINRFVRHPYIIALAYLGYLIVITIWNVPFPLLIVGVCLSVMVIYLVGDAKGKSNKVRKEILLLGKYSLFGYISQIAILQVLYASFRHFNLGIPMLVVSFFSSFILTVISVEVVDRARTAATSVDRLYKAVFA